MTTFTLTDEDFWRLVSALEDDAFKALHSAKEAQTTGYYKADETAEKRIQHAHKLFDIANQLKAQAAGMIPGTDCTAHDERRKND